MGMRTWLAATLLLALTTAGCASAPAEKPTDAPVTAPGKAGVVTMTVTLPHTVLHPGDMLQAEVQVTNTGSEAVPLGRGCDMVTFEVTDDQGVSVLPPPPKVLCTMMARLLPAGATQAFTGQVAVPNHKGRLHAVVLGPYPDLKTAPVVIFVQ